MAYCPSSVAPRMPEEAHAPLPRHASLQHRSSMADLLDRVVKSLLRSPSVGGQVSRIACVYYTPLVYLLCISYPACQRMLTTRGTHGTFSRYFV